MAGCVKGFYWGASLDSRLRGNDTPLGPLSRGQWARAWHVMPLSGRIAGTWQGAPTERNDTSRLALGSGIGVFADAGEADD
jgi:hypothetical protein